MHEPLISVLLPTYNRASLLPRAIHSVLTQTYQHWELIVWNDGSSDDTEQVLRSVEDERVRYFTGQNHGKPYALNQALAEAKGDWIAFLDDDDEWTEDKLATQLPQLEGNPILGFVFSNFHNVDLTSQSEGDAFEQTVAGLALLTTAEGFGGCRVILSGFLEGICEDNFIGFDTVLARRDLFTDHGTFNELLSSTEDFEFWWRCGLAGVKSAYTEKVLMRRYKYPGSLSSPSVMALTHQLKTLDICKQQAIQQGQSHRVNLLKPRYRNAWQNMIVQQDLKQAIFAFKQSIRYGFRPGALRLLLVAISNHDAEKEKSQ